MDELTLLQAEILKTMASPRRLEILHRLAAGPCAVGPLADELGISQPNVSQHLAILRTAGLVEAERDGREVRYRLSDPFNIPPGNYSDMLFGPEHYTPGPAYETRES